MRTRHALVILAAALIVLSHAMAADAIPDWSFSLIPASGSVSGPPGSTIGWGYEITNPDPANWLALTGVSADAFLNGTPINIFDFPNVGPSSTLSVPYDGFSGLYELTWDAGAPDGFVNSGTFVLTADWYDGDPLAGGAFVEAAPERFADYSATVVSATAIPEPLTLMLLVVGLGVTGFVWKSRRLTPGRRQPSVQR